MSEVSQVNEKHGLDSDSNGAHRTGALQRSTSVVLSHEQFEKMFLAAGGIQAKGDAAQRFGNPTAFSIATFTIPLLPFSLALLGWGDITQSALIPLVGAFYWVGGGGLALGGLLDWILGNTLPSTVFMTFAGFYLSFGFVLQPSQLIASTFASDLRDYYCGLGYYLFTWALILMIFAISCMRTNIAFLCLFATIIPGVWILGVAYYLSGVGKLTHVDTLFKTSGAFMFACSMVAFYNLIAIMFLLNDVPIKLPVWDMSGFMVKKKVARQAED